MLLALLATATVAGIAIAAWFWFGSGMEQTASPAPSSSEAVSTRSRLSSPPSNPSVSAGPSSHAAAETPAPAPTAAIPPSVERNREFAKAADAGMAQLADAAQRIRASLSDGTELRAVVTDAKTAVGSLRDVNPSDGDAAQWQARLSLLDSTIAVATDLAMQGNREALFSVSDELSRQVASTSMWIQSLRG